MEERTYVEWECGKFRRKDCRGSIIGPSPTPDEIRKEVFRILIQKDAYGYPNQKKTSGDKKCLSTTGNIKIVDGGLDSGKVYVEYKYRLRRRWISFGNICWAEKRREIVSNIKNFPEELI